MIEGRSQTSQRMLLMIKLVFNFDGLKNRIQLFVYVSKVCLRTTVEPNGWIELFQERESFKEKTQKIL